MAVGQVLFDTARPEEIVVTSQRFFIPANASQVAVTARLIRAIGIPTEGFNVTWSALNPAGLTIGHFNALVPSKADGSALAQFSAEAVLYRGPAPITASAGSVSGGVDVEIVDP